MSEKRHNSLCKNRMKVNSLPSSVARRTGSKFPAYNSTRFLFWQANAHIVDKQLHLLQNLRCILSVTRSICIETMDWNTHEMAGKLLIALHRFFVPSFVSFRQFQHRSHSAIESLSSPREMLQSLKLLPIRMQILCSITVASVQTIQSFANYAKSFMREL